MDTSCLSCGKPIDEDSPDPLFCSERCWQRFYGRGVAPERPGVPVDLAVVDEVFAYGRALAAGLTAAWEQLWTELEPYVLKLRDALADALDALLARADANRLARSAPRTVGRPCHRLSHGSLVTRYVRWRM